MASKRSPKARQAHPIFLPASLVDTGLLRVMSVKPKRKRKAPKRKARAK